VVTTDGIVGGEQSGPFNNGAKFADVSRPMVGVKFRQHFRFDRGDVFTELPGIKAQKKLGQCRKIFLSFAKGWNPEGHRLQPLIKITVKSTVD